MITIHLTSPLQVNAILITPDDAGDALEVDLFNVLFWSHRGIETTGPGGLSGDDEHFN